MLRSALLALLVTGLASVVARAQAINPTPGTEAAQTNGLLGTPFWIIVGVIFAFAVLFAFRVRGRRRR